MTDITCKACGEQLGELEDVEVGDTLTCPECETGYEFVENPNPAYRDHPFMQVDQSTVDSPQKPGVDEIVDVETVVEHGEEFQVVTWIREDGTRVRDYEEDFPGEVPGGDSE